MNTTIVKNLTNFSEDLSNQKLGILDKIKNASSEEEIKAFLERGSTFKNVRKRTMKLWVKAASKRSEFFKN
jgi:hypothetical protein